MAETNHQIKITTELEDKASAGLKKSSAAILDFQKAAEKAGKSLQGMGRQTEELAKKNKSGLATSFASVKASTIAAVAAVAGFTAVLGKVINEIAEAETATKRMSFALQSAGISSGLAVSNFQKFAKSIQATSKYSDEAVMALGTLLTSAGVGYDKLEVSARAAIEYAARFGKSLDEAGMEVARTFSGVVPRGLGMTVRQLKALTEEQLRAGGAADLILDKFKGSALNELNTFSGAIASLKNSIGEFAESMAPILGPAMEFWSNAMRSMGSAIEKLGDKIAGGGGKGMTKLEQWKDQLRVMQAEADDLQKRLPGTVARATSGRHPGLGAVAETMAEDLGKKQAEIRDIKREILQMEKAETEQIGLQVEGQKKLNAEEAEKLKRKAALKEDATNMEAIMKAGEQEAAFKFAQIEEEGKQRKAMIEQAAKDGYKFEKMSKEDLLAKSLRMERDERTQLIEDLGKKQTEEDDKARSRLKKLVEENPISQFISDPTKTVLSGIGGMVGGPMGAAVGSFISDNLGALANMGNFLKDMGKSVWGAVKGVGTAILTFGGLFDFFGGPDYYNSIGDAVAAAMDKTQFAKTMANAVEALRSIGDSFRSLPDKLARAQVESARIGSFQRKSIEDFFSTISAQFTIQYQKRNPNTGKMETKTGVQNMSLLDAINKGKDISTGKFGIEDTERLKAALQALSEQLMAEAQAIMDVANLRIQKLTEETDALIKLNDEALVPIRESIDKLTASRTGLASTFDDAIKAVGGGLDSPSQTVDALRSQYDAASGEAKAALGGQLAGALEDQFKQAQDLAASGAISGEELKRIQADILSQLEQTKIESLSEMDQLIAAAKSQEAALVAANEALRADLKLQTDAIKEEAVKQIDKLNEILVAIQNNDYQKIVDGLNAWKVEFANNIIEWVKNFGQHASGTNLIMRDGPAYLHKGEQVIPSARVGNGGGGITININGVPAGGSTKEALTKAVRDILVQNLGNIRGAVRRASA